MFALEALESPEYTMAQVSAIHRVAWGQKANFWNQNAVNNKKHRSP